MTRQKQKQKSNSKEKEKTIWKMNKPDKGRQSCWQGRYEMGSGAGSLRGAQSWLLGDA